MPALHALLEEASCRAIMLGLDASVLGLLASAAVVEGNSSCQVSADSTVDPIF